MNKRIEHIDIAKGIAIILVVCSHTYAGPLIFPFSAFDIPLFFICAGFTCTIKDDMWISFKRKAIKLLKPYFFFNIILFLCAQRCSLREIFGVFYSRYCLYPIDVIDNPRLLTVGNFPLWFLTCMIVCYLLFYIIIYHEKYQYYLVAFYLLFTALLDRLPILLPWSIDIAFLMAVYMYVGYKLKNVSNVFNTLKPHPIIVIAIVVYLMVLPYCNDIDISKRYYDPSYFIYIIAGLSGSMSIIYISYLLSYTVLKKTLQQIGIHSLTIFCIEMPFIYFIENITTDSFLGSHPYIVGTLATISAIIGGYILSILLHRNKRIKSIVF